MSEQKTVKEWLLTLPEPYKSEALKQSNCLGDKCDSLDGAIDGAFIWDMTKEGDGYWEDLHERSLDGEFDNQEPESDYHKFTAFGATPPQPENPNNAYRGWRIGTICEIIDTQELGHVVDVRRTGLELKNRFGVVSIHHPSELRNLSRGD